MSNKDNASIEIDFNVSHKQKTEETYQIRKCCFCCNKKEESPYKVLQQTAALDILVSCPMILLHTIMACMYGWQGYTSFAVSLVFI